MVHVINMHCMMMWYMWEDGNFAQVLIRNVEVSGVYVETIVVIRQRRMRLGMVVVVIIKRLKTIYA